ncbi:MAG: hypothetical protein EXQ89_02715 [Rhodospirillaceae bacterium]|nr:hypothetical protein [Rhodospirillaceae bacterium]
MSCARHAPRAWHVKGRMPRKIEDVAITAREGEGILTGKAMQRYPGLLNKANKGTLNRGILSR